MNSICVSVNNRRFLNASKIENEAQKWGFIVRANFAAALRRFQEEYDISNHFVWSENFYEVCDSLGLLENYENGRPFWGIGGREFANLYLFAI